VDHLQARAIGLAPQHPAPVGHHDPAVGERVLDAVRTGPARLPGVESTEGKAVLEMAVVQVSKGAAIDTLLGMTDSVVAIAVRRQPQTNETGHGAVL
jgi:trehalose 6-phosphate phosphatase